MMYVFYRYYSIVFQVDENIISIRVRQPYDREERKWGHRRFAIEGIMIPWWYKYQVLTSLL